MSPAVPMEVAHQLASCSVGRRSYGEQHSAWCPFIWVDNFYRSILRSRITE